VKTKLPAVDQVFLKTCRLIPAAFAVACLLHGGSAWGQFVDWIGYAPQSRVIITRSYVVNGEDYACSYNYGPQRYYLYDYVNRPNPLTPEPVWRDMFPGLRGRIEAERRSFGVSGQSGREALYWRELRNEEVRRYSK